MTNSDDAQIKIGAKRVLRNYLIRCHSIVSKEYPAISSMEPEQAADYLIELRDAGKIDITLDCVDEIIHCKIKHHH